MRFKEFTKNYKIFVDLNNTLLDQEDDKICERPGAKQFIGELQNLAPVCILTHGITEQAKQLAYKIGLSLPVIGRDKFSTVKPLESPILIDNKSVHSSYTVSKLEALGIDSSRLIKVKSWKCGDNSDNELSVILDQVKKMLVVHVNTNKPKSHHKS